MATELATQLDAVSLAAASPAPSSSTPPSKPYTVSPKDLPCKVIDIPGKGKGLVATRDILKGATIFAETPLFVLSEPTLLPADQLEQRLKDIVDALSPKDRSAFLALSASPVHKAYGPYGRIYRTNAFNNAGDESGFFPLTARMNHSCTPLASREYDVVNQVRHVVALKDIKKNVEITDSYVPLLQDRDSRQAALKAMYGFVCTCPPCSLTRQKLKDSDKRRRRIAELGDTIPSLDPLAIVHACQEALALYKLEGLVTGAAMFANDAWQACAWVSDLENGRKWLKKNLEFLALARGKESDYYAEAAELFEHPETERTIGKMASQTLQGPRD